MLHHKIYYCCKESDGLHTAWLNVISSRSTVTCVVPPWWRVGLEPVHLCTCSTLGLLLAGLAQNVSEGGRCVLDFCDPWWMNYDARCCSNMCVGSSGRFWPLVVYGLSNMEWRTFLQNYPSCVVRKSVPIGRQAFTIYKRVSSCDNEMFQCHIFNAFFTGSLSLVISWTADGRFHVTASFCACLQNCEKWLLTLACLSICPRGITLLPLDRFS